MLTSKEFKTEYDKHNEAMSQMYRLLNSHLSATDQDKEIARNFCKAWSNVEDAIDDIILRT